MGNSPAEMEVKEDAKIRLFVYGTLRKGGVSAHYLQDALLLEEKVHLKGYALYDAGWYPFAVPASSSSIITGDVFELPVSWLSVLDEYEGPEYSRKYLPEHKMLIYLQKEIGEIDLPLVKEGDWLEYWRRKSE